MDKKSEYTYKGDGYFAGLPARDMDADEWNELPKSLRDAALKAGIYEKDKKHTEVKDA